VLSEDFPAQLAGFRPGSLVAGYRLEAQIGAGGMAVVFRARDERLDRLVALKILAPAMAADHGFRRRFMAESRAAAAVDDPHIIPVYEAGEADGVLFIAMRFVRGGDLGLILEREGTLPPDRTVAFVSAVASALDAAHRAGLVHRDVKPANMLVDTRPGQPEHVYLSDFGVSKATMSSVSLTGTGQFLGTPHYSAPEQIQGLAVDGRTDQYALACVAYELLTGAVPFARDQGMAVLFAHMSQPPPSLGAGFPRAADEALTRALAKVPEKRYGSCSDFADALRTALGLAPGTSPSPAAAPVHPPPRLADRSAAATLDRLPGSAPVAAATVPPAPVTTTGSGYPEAARSVPGADAAPPPARQPPGPPGIAGEPGGPAAEPARPATPATHSSWWSGAEHALAADPVRPAPPESRRTRRAPPGRPRAGRRRWPIVTTALAVLAVVVVLGGYLVVQWTQGQYYLGESGGQVVVYRGISDPSKFLWISLSHVYQRTGIPLAQVPANYQQVVTTDGTTGSLSHVGQAVTTIRAAVNLCRNQYAALATWVVQEDHYQAEVAQLHAAHKPTTGVSNPGPQPSGPGTTCGPPQAFGISASALSPAPAGSS
jgi:serine/threonine protein kinase